MINYVKYTGSEQVLVFWACNRISWGRCVFWFSIIVPVFQGFDYFYIYMENFLIIPIAQWIRVNFGFVFLVSSIIWGRWEAFWYTILVPLLQVCDLCYILGKRHHNPFRTLVPSKIWFVVFTPCFISNPKYIDKTQRIKKYMLLVCTSSVIGLYRFNQTLEKNCWHSIYWWLICRQKICYIPTK